MRKFSVRRSELESTCCVGASHPFTMTRSMTPNDYLTLLSRAVASLDRDSYAARYAVYDREHKALLRRLATAEQPCPDVAGEEQAFRDAILRIEFGDADGQPALVPQDEPAAEEAGHANPPA